MKSREVGIIGAGYTGLSAAYYLAKAGHKVTILESSDHVGGLAAGFKENKWDWSLEEHYHHWFTNDDSILNLAKEIGFPVTIYRPKTSILSDGQIYRFDSPMSLLRFPHLNIIDKLRTGGLMIFLKIIPFLKYLESVTAKKFLIRWGGINSWNKLWGPLFEGKFGLYSDKIPAIWFWARIKKRTPFLVYPDGGYAMFSDQLAMKIRDKGGEIKLNTPIKEIKKSNNKITIIADRRIDFDKVICTLPTGVYINLTKDLPKAYQESLKPLQGLGAVTLVLSLKEKFFSDGTYWLNINERGFPFLAVVEHTNFVDKSHYSGEHLLYIGNYLPVDHKYFDLSADQIVEEFDRALRKINSKFSKSKICKSYVFKAKFAQPIVPLNYSSEVPKIETPIDGLYLANMQQVYPWDRGTNYAVHLGYKVSEMITNN